MMKKWGSLRANLKLWISQHLGHFSTTRAVFLLCPPTFETRCYARWLETSNCHLLRIKTKHVGGVKKNQFLLKAFVLFLNSTSLNAIQIGLHSQPPFIRLYVSNSVSYPDHKGHFLMKMFFNVLLLFPSARQLELTEPITQKP